MGNSMGSTFNTFKLDSQVDVARRMWNLRMRNSNKIGLSKNYFHTPITKYQDLKKMNPLFNDKPITFCKRKVNRFNLFK